MTIAIAFFSEEKLGIDVWLDDDWKVSYDLVLQGDRFVTQEVRILPTHEGDLPKGGLPGGMLRRIPANPTRYVDEAVRNWEVKPTSRPSPEESAKARASFERFLRLLRRGANEKPEKHASGRGRKPVPALELAKLARDYVQLLPKSQRPIVDVAMKHRLSQSQARARIHKARKRGILQSSGIGRGAAGGHLSEKAKELLAKQEKRGRRVKKR